MLRKLTLKNYAQHQGEREFNLYGHAVGIIGRNGSGKSNLARAISNTLTGKYHKPKNKIITRGESEGWAMLTFDVPSGEILTVYRELHSNLAWLRRAETGEVLADTAKEVNRIVLEKLQVPADVLDEIIFVGQEDINGLLFAKDAARERVAQSFFGVGAAREIEAALTSVLSGIAQDFDPQLPGEITSLRARISAIDKEVADLSNQVREGSALLLSDEDRNECLEAIQSTRLVMESERRIKELKISESDIESKLEQTRARIETTRALRGEKSIADLEDRIDEIVERGQQVGNHGRITSRLGVLETELRRTENNLANEEDCEVLAADLSAVRAEETSLRRVVQIREELLERKSEDKGHCPVCFSKLEPNLDELMRDQNGLDYILQHDLGESVATRTANLSAAKVRRGTLLKRIEDLQQDINGCRAMLDELPKDLLGRNYASEEQALRTELTNLIRTNRELEGLENVAFKYEKELEQIRATLSYHQSPKSSRIFTLEEVKSASEKISIDDIRMADLQRLQGEVSSKIQLRKFFLESLVEKRCKLGLQRANAKRREFISMIRDRFHYSGAPQRVIQSRLSSIRGRINYYLDLLGTPYRVEISEGLKFRCVFSDKEVDADELSGGEKTDLSNSFRLASSESYCSRVGFMIMDEPTAWLDDRTVDRMTGVVERLIEIGEMTGQQFVFVTHALPLVSSFDQVIEL